MNRLKTNAGSLANTIDTTEREPITSAPDEERPKQFAAFKLVGVYSILTLIREELVRLVQERIKTTEEKDWSHISQWDPSVPEGMLEEEGYIAQMRQHTVELITQIEIIESALPQQQQEILLPAVEQVHTLLNTLRGILFQFVRSLAIQYPEDQLITYVKMNSTFATLLGAPEEASPDV